MSDPTFIKIMYHLGGWTGSLGALGCIKLGLSRMAVAIIATLVSAIFIILAVLQ